MYIGKYPRTKTQGLKHEYDTNFKGRCIEMEGYFFNIVPISSDKFASTMKELERYIGATYSDSCQPAIMTETLETITDP